MAERNDQTTRMVTKLPLQKPKPLVNVLTNGWCAWVGKCLRIWRLNFFSSHLVYTSSAFPQNTTTGAKLMSTVFLIYRFQNTSEVNCCNGNYEYIFLLPGCEFLRRKLVYLKIYVRESGITEHNITYSSICFSSSSQNLQSLISKN